MKDAQDHLGDVIDLALREGPQTIRTGGEAVVIVRAEDYQALLTRRSFKDVLLDGPSLEGLDLTRDRTAPRAIDFGK